MTRKSFVWALLACLSGLVRVGEAQWTYIGGMPWGHLCILQLNSSPGTYLSGTYRVAGYPGSGGVYRWSGQDTVWEYVSLMDWRVYALKEYPSYPGALFAATHRGLYRSSDEGATWTQITNYLASDFDYEDFAISPFDSLRWFVGANYSWWPTGMLLMSNDGGATWSYVSEENHGEWRDLTFSLTDPSVLYGDRQASISRLHLADSTVETVVQAPAGQWMWELVRHATQPWLYALADLAIFRYDETSGDTMMRVLPDTTYGTHSMRWAPDSGLIIGGADHVYWIDENLENLQVVDGSTPPAVGTRVLFASPQHWIAQFGGVQGLYSHMPGLAAEPRMPARPASTESSIIVFPQPAHGSLTIDLQGSLLRDPRIEVFDLLGRRVTATRVQSISSSRYRLFFPETLSSGSYYLVASAPTGCRIGRFIINK